VRYSPEGPLSHSHVLMVSAVFWVPSSEIHRELKVDQKNHLNATLHKQETQDTLHSVHCFSGFTPSTRRGIFFFLSNILIPILAASKQICNIPTWISIVLPKYNELANGRRGSLLFCPSSLAYLLPLWASRPSARERNLARSKHR